MSARRVTAKPSVVPDWRQTFVEELGVLAFDVGIPRATVRVLAWLVVCDPPEQSAPEIQSALQLSAGAVSAATRTLIGIGMLERAARAGDRHMYYKVRAGGWEVALRSRLRTLVGIREVADRALLAAPGVDDRLHDLRDVYAWFENRLDELLAQRRTTP
jgi:DNA-binding transcriptional regulator GbsR (MarR family)